MTTKLFEKGLIWQWASAPTFAAPRESRGYANWMLIDEAKGEIVAVGSGDVPGFIRTKATTTVDLDGKLVLPGLHDSHIHVYLIGEVAHYVDLRGTASFDELRDRVQAHAAKHPDIEWIVGFGWEQDKLSADARYPSRFDLDAIVPGRPMYLWRACWHIAVVNSKALEVAGLQWDAIDAAWTSIPGGVVDMDATGKPTGVLREAAVSLVHKFIQEQSDELRKKYLLRGLQTCLEFGLTGVHTNDHNAWYLYQELQASGRVPLRVYVTPDQNEIGQTTIPAPKTQDGLLSCDRVKIFSDGSLGAETAALREPYRNTSNRGVLMESDASMLHKIQVAHAAGYRLEVHAIGDRAAAQVLHAMESAGLEPADRPILTHCQILGPDLLDQMARLGVIADIQPSFVITDASFAEKRLPPACVPYSYCWKRMMDHGILCAGGSDAPIETSNPFQGLYDAMHRAAPGTSNFLDSPAQQLTFASALQLYTLNGAFAANAETRLGHLDAGFYADFVVLNHNVATDATKLLAPDVLHSVYVHGIKRHERDGNAPPNLPPAPGLPGRNGKIRLCRCCR
ncbi:hypothetical protein SDRG_02976 [Saprolegnia diclina VS20]|uniref:Amidohydrolase 3 domain-containing protein n=1 Tax=Saprolegnia diclina (strain VS20) TaxID=1156394 RepID=T0QN91_SAPDV|nr:hypothetical protein SDRG_02976 [Saprolegnia diclina VS20]EQC39539.1 hypothetical protein SDRG_02976 [Saprolegnia diclina VS20]|eukprot:XP_008606811.1 hypothetical protein SDRG_02976 [Saprolegnia diclina VS20]